MVEELNNVVVKEPEKTVVAKRHHSKMHYVIYFIAGALEVLLLFRLVFKMTGADATSGFVSFIYSVTNFFVAPYAMFVFEPGTLVAMAIYAILAWGIAKIVGIVVRRPHNAE